MMLVGRGWLATKQVTSIGSERALQVGSGPVDWSPDHQFAVYYRQDGESIPSPGIIPIAKIDAGTEAFNVPGSVKVTVELAK